MNENEIYRLADAICKQYDDQKTIGIAIEKVKDKYPEADLNILWAMWSAIDAYKDLNR